MSEPEYRPLSPCDVSSVRLEFFHDLRARLPENAPSAETLERWFNLVSDTVDRSHENLRELEKFLGLTVTPITMQWLENCNIDQLCVHAIHGLRATQVADLLERAHQQFYIAIALAGRRYYRDEGCNPDQFAKPELITFTAETLRSEAVPALP